MRRSLLFAISAPVVAAVYLITTYAVSRDLLGWDEGWSRAIAILYMGVALAFLIAEAFHGDPSPNNHHGEQ